MKRLIKEREAKREKEDQLQLANTDSKDVQLFMIKNMMKSNLEFSNYPGVIQGYQQIIKNKLVVDHEVLGYLLLTYQAKGDEKSVLFLKKKLANLQS
eukprot:Pgem_evm1s10945